MNGEKSSWERRERELCFFSKLRLDSDKKSKRNSHMMESVKKQNEAANLEIADLKRKLETNVEEKKAEHQETLKKLKE
ncbi:hypothetical protein Bca52824_074707 [Brassica carinata]|nr:hypothetical protein Bca52824_074707 [Brassica carinata]